jgi:hypothetical protein
MTKKQMATWVLRNCKFAQQSGWRRFMDYGSWDNVVEAGMGNPTPEEEKAIMSLGYWGKPISQGTIRGLEQGQPYDDGMVSPSGIAIHKSLVDGEETESFASAEEMRKFIEERLQGAHNVSQDGFSTEFGNYSLIGTTMADLGLSVPSKLDELDFLEGEEERDRHRERER